MSRRGSKVALTIIFLLFGFLLATQLRVRPPVPVNVHYQRAEELSLLLSSTEEERDRLRDEVQMLRDRVAEAMVAGESQVKVLQEELLRARILAGLAEISGPGLTVEMNDAKKEAVPGQDPSLFIIHDDDVLAVVNELFAAGAEALSINDQRIVATTEIRCAGAVFMINGVRLAPPLKIQTIGDPEVLQNAMKMRGGVVDNLSFWGIEVKIKAEQEIILPAYKGSLNFRFAQPVQKRGIVMWYLLAALVVGIAVGLNIPWKLPVILARYLAVSLLAGVDTSLGGLRASLEGDFDIIIFATGFLANTVLAAGFVYIGDILGIELHLAAVVALGVRIFNNIGLIRRLYLKEWTEKKTTVRTTNED